MQYTHGAVIAPTIPVYEFVLRPRAVCYNRHEFSNVFRLYTFFNHFFSVSKHNTLSVAYMAIIYSNDMFTKYYNSTKDVPTLDHKDASLKTQDTIGNCQRPVSSLGVSQHNMHKITNL